MSEPLKDTVDDAASLNVSVLGKVKLDKLPKATGVIVVYGLGVPKGFHDGTAERGNAHSESPFYTSHVCPSLCVWIQMLNLCSLVTVF